MPRHADTPLRPAHGATPAPDARFMRRRSLARLALLPLLPFPAGAQAPEPLVPILGRRLHGPGGEELGRVVDVVLDRDGRAVAAVVDVGGFLGLGSRRVAMAWHLLRIRPEEGGARLWIDIAPDVVIAAPEFRREDPATIFDPTPLK